MKRELIELVKNNSILYNIELEDYKNLTKKQEAWRSISAETGIDVDGCKKLWKSLRDTYMKYKKRTIKLDDTNAMREWKYTKYLRFLDNVNTERSNSSRKLLANPETYIGYETKLIEEIKKHEILYNAQCPEYKELKKREIIWKEIADILKVDVKYCKKRWRSLRDTHQKIKKREETEPYNCDTRTWKYAEAMSFMDVAKGYERKSLNADNLDTSSETNDNGDSSILCQSHHLSSLRLIQEVKRNEILYNPELEGYEDLSKTQEIWCRIGNTLHSNADDCKQRWLDLLAIYNKYQKRMNNRKTAKRKTTTNKEQLKILWRYENEMKFLDKFQKTHDLTEATECVGFDDDDAGVNDENPKDHCRSLISEKLIEEVKKHQILYDQNLPEYKDFDRKYIIWERVSDAVNLDADACRKRWKHLRVCYNRMDRNDENTVKWKVVEKLDFLKNYTYAQTWSEIELIEEVKKHKVLYRKFRTTNEAAERARAWKSISKALNINDSICKRRWFTLRVAYRNHKRRKSSTAENTWRFEEQIKFLDKYMTFDCNKTKHNSETSAYNEIDTDEFIDEIHQHSEFYSTGELTAYQNEEYLDDNTDDEDDDDASTESSSPIYEMETDYFDKDNNSTAYTEHTEEIEICKISELPNDETPIDEPHFDLAAVNDTQQQLKCDQHNNKSINPNSTSLVLKKLGLAIKNAELTWPQTLEIESSISSVIFEKLIKFQKK